MPKELKDIRNYPRRSGTSQPQRYKPVLLGAEVKIDERTVADYIVFAQRLSKHLAFYNQFNIPHGTWEPFLKNDITYQLAVISSDKIKLWNEAWNELMENVEGINGAPATDDDHIRYFTWRFDFLYTIVGKLLDAYACSQTLNAWKNGLVAICSSAHLEIIWSLLKQYYASAEKFALIKSDIALFSYKEISLSKKATITQQLAAYDGSVSTLVILETPLFADTDFIFGNMVSVPEQVAVASEYLNDLAGQLVNIYSNIIETAKKYLDITLGSYDTHQPQAALFYAFLQLADEHRNEINGLLLKHLDFYYKQVLRVKEKTWQPDQAFVTFELFKNVNEYFIPSGSLLVAGKDNTRKDVYYKTQQDILVNKASPSQVKSFSVIRNSLEKNVRKNASGIYGCSAADSIDGKGKPLPAGQSWETFHADADNRQLVGLSFYSALLHEAVGESRQFELWIQLSASAQQHIDAKNFIMKYGVVKILTEKDPLIFDDLSSARYDAVDGYIKILFTVSGKTKLSKASPNASLIFGHKLEPVDDSFFGVIEMFQTASLVNLHIVIPSATVKITQVETAAGKTDLSSAFAAFGGVPKVGSSFTVIEPLLKNRLVNNLQLNIEWDGKSERNYSVSVEYPGHNNGVSKTINKDESISVIQLTTDTVTAFNSDEIKIVLTPGDLGHSTYANELMTYILSQTKQ